MVKLRLTKAQQSKLRRFGRLKLTVVFVQTMPNGKHRSTRHTITVR